WPRDACDWIAREQEHRLLGRPGADIGHVNMHLDRVGLMYVERRDTQIRQLESPVTQAVPEREQRLIRQIQILTGIVIAGVGRPAARALAEEHRDLAFGSRPAYRRAPTRGDTSGQEISGRIAGLTTEEPGGEQCIDLLDQPRDHERPPRE